MFLAGVSLCVTRSCHGLYLTSCRAVCSVVHRWQVVITARETDMLRTRLTDDEHRERAQRMARKYAAKWRADEREGAPTDEALREAFAGCVRPAHPAEYPLIREAIERQSGSTSVATLAVLLLALVPVSLVAVFVASLAGAVAGVAA